MDYQLSENGPVSLSIYDMQGRKLQNVLSGQQQRAGGYERKLQVQDLEAGIYLVLLRTEQESRKVKIVLID